MAKPHQIILCYRGPQASGKTTAAIKLIQQDFSFRRVERDVIREMLFGRRWTGGKSHDEDLVTAVKFHTMHAIIQAGKNLVISDMNLNEKDLRDVREFAEAYNQLGYNITVEVDDSFMRVPLDELLRRDKERGNLVGAAVITRTYRKHIGWPSRYIEPREQNQELPKCIVVDVDGTITKEPHASRRPYDWKKVGLDEPNSPVIEIVKALASNFTIVFVSGRSDVCRKETIEWINEKFSWSSDNYWLFMRNATDFRPDTEVKKDLYEKFVFPCFYVVSVFDDRNSVVDMARKELKLPTFQVQEGKF